MQLGARQNGLRVDSAYADLGVRDAELAAHAEFRKHLYAYDVVPEAKKVAGGGGVERDELRSIRIVPASPGYLPLKRGGGRAKASRVGINIPRCLIPTPTLPFARGGSALPMRYHLNVV